MTGEQMRADREKAGVTIDVVAARAGVEPTRLSRIERGLRQPTAEEATRLGEALDELVNARAKVAAVAAEVGWPMPA
jgi:transcriptional regulator with XRE-family HTH domain